MPPELGGTDSVVLLEFKFYSAKFCYVIGRCSAEVSYSTTPTLQYTRRHMLLPASPGVAAARPKDRVMLVVETAVAGDVRLQMKLISLGQLACGKFFPGLQLLEELFGVAGHYELSSRKYAEVEAGSACKKSRELQRRGACPADATCTLPLRPMVTSTDVD
ncbi:hypothetical protein Anapl_09586 [Anas platyrhynchos]|uniref:Uncharacterized protein n=1 Tax=Anas platyrhynchos TaxID=8839 RepID=R0L787_ANAPL|nr:hypothetical protein Anapl_09586 [Anas platyrhynchos]